MQGMSENIHVEGHAGSGFNSFVYDFMKCATKKAVGIKSRGNLGLITSVQLINMGIKGLFEEYKQDYAVLFDQGELHAIALAKAMGIAAFVSDDTKDQGPRS